MDRLRDFAARPSAAGKWLEAPGASANDHGGAPRADDEVDASGDAGSAPCPTPSNRWSGRLGARCARIHRTVALGG